jgi:hypothetical protein
MAKPSKYRNKKVTIHGILFDSQKEANRYLELKSREQKGEIEHLKLQETFKIVINGQLICKYIADFVYHDLERKKVIVEDVKSVFTAKNEVYRLKKKLMKAVNNIEITEIKR